MVPRLAPGARRARRRPAAGGLSSQWVGRFESRWRGPELLAALEDHTRGRWPSSDQHALDGGADSRTLPHLRELGGQRSAARRADAAARGTPTHRARRPCRRGRGEVYERSAGSGAGQAPDQALEVRTGPAPGPKGRRPARPSGDRAGQQPRAERRPARRRGPAGPASAARRARTLRPAGGAPADIPPQASASARDGSHGRACPRAALWVRIPRQPRSASSGKGVSRHGRCTSTLEATGAARSSSRMISGRSSDSV